MEFQCDLRKWIELIEWHSLFLDLPYEWNIHGVLMEQNTDHICYYWAYMR